MIKTLAAILCVQVLFIGFVAVYFGWVGGGQSVLATLGVNQTAAVGAATVTSAMAQQPQDFGAKCDGVTDDAVALQAWLNALTANTGSHVGYIPSGSTCRSSKALKINLASTATPNVKPLQIKGDGFYNSVISFDAAVAAPNLSIVSVNPTFYWTLEDFSVRGSTNGNLVQVGKTDLSDQHNNFTLNLEMQNGSTGSNATALWLGSVYNAQINVVANGGKSCGSGLASIVLAQVQFSTLTGSFSNSRYGMYITKGYSFGNTIIAPDIEEVCTGVVIDSKNARRNTWIGGTIVWKTGAAVDAKEGSQNLFQNVNFASAGAPFAGSIGATLVPTDASDKIGLGTVAPAADIHIVRSGAAALRLQSGANVFDISQSEKNAYINNYTPGGAINFAADGYTEFYVGGQSRMKFTKDKIQIAGLGAGTVMSDATGNLSVSSDERLKTIDGAFDRSVQSIIGLSPIMYHWNELSGLEMDGQYTGFSAQNVKEFIPEAVSKDANGYLTISDRPILATLVNSFKELWQKVINHDQTLDLHAQKIEELEARIADLEAMTAKNAEGSD